MDAFHDVCFVLSVVWLVAIGVAASVRLVFPRISARAEERKLRRLQELQAWRLSRLVEERQKKEAKNEADVVEKVQG